MSLIGQKIKASIINEKGNKEGTAEGVVIDKVQGVKRVSNHLPQGNGRDGMYYNYVVVDYYILKTANGFEKVEAMQIFGSPEESSSPGEIFPYVGHE